MSNTNDYQNHPEVRLQRDYWRSNPIEKSGLLTLHEENLLGWPQLLRLHHLVCAEIIESIGFSDDLDSDEETLPPASLSDLHLKLVARLASAESPYRPYPAAVWQEKGDDPQGRNPDLIGVLSNASASHLGCLEIIRVDEHNSPASLAFIPFAEIISLEFQGRSLFRAVRIVYADQREEIAFAPLLYGVSWQSPASYDRDGSMTRLRYPSHADGIMGIGVGHQDLTVGSSLFGIGSVHVVKAVAGVGG